LKANDKGKSKSKDNTAAEGFNSFSRVSPDKTIDALFAFTA
jgi:hypothetical protein